MAADIPKKHYAKIGIKKKIDSLEIDGIPLNKSQRRLAYHIVDGQTRTGEAVTIPNTALQKSGMKRMTAKEREDLIRPGLFKRSNFTKGKATQYSMTPELEQEVFENLLGSILAGDIVGGLVVLETGEFVEPERSELECEPELTQRAFPKIINKINPFEIQERFRDLHAEMLWYVGSKEAKYLRDKLTFNLRAYEAVMRQRMDDNDFTYIPAYRGCKTGRMFEINTGLQGMSRDFKKAAWESLGAINYDIRSSQITGILEHKGLKDSTIRTLTDYVKNPEAKYEFAQRVGIDVDLWKKSLLSLFFGAKVCRNPYATIYKDILSWDFGTYKTESIAKFDKFVEVATPFIQARDDWFSVLERMIPEMKFNRKGIDYIENAVGKWTDDLGNIGFISSFLLQGIEAKFIYTLIDLSRKHGYQVLSNEHDGLVTMGMIPQLAIEEAKELTGLHRLELVDKGF